MTDNGQGQTTPNAVSRYVDVGGSRMHYVEAGAGAPMVFLHGNPTSSYLWRGVMPYLTPHARCIAPDLIGMGDSDKPTIRYRFADHYDYLVAFLDALGLDQTTFVVHDWGGSLAFRYFANHPDRVRGLAFMEVMLESLTWREMPWNFRLAFPLMRAPGIGWLILSVANAFVNLVLPLATRRHLDRATMRRYRRAFPTVASRRPVRQWPREIPLNGTPSDNAALFQGYSEFLTATSVPKLLCYTEPGALIGRRRCQWAMAQLPNLTTAYLGEGLHFTPEEHPEAIGEALADWYGRCVTGD